MNKTLVFGSFLTLITLSACSSSQAASMNAQARNGNRGQMMRQNPEDLQKYADEANGAPDKTELTREQFTGEIQALMQAQTAKFQQNGSGSIMRRPYGSGAMMRNGSGSMPGRFGSGAMRQGQGGEQDRLATATTFLKYTDSNAQEILLALDADGKVVMKWPMAFGGRGMRPQSQAPANGQ